MPRDSVLVRSGGKQLTLTSTLSTGPSSGFEKWYGHWTYRECRRHEQGESTRGVKLPPLVMGVRGISPEKNLKFKMSVEAILMHFETMFACEIRLIVQAFHVAVLKRKGVRGISPLDFFLFKMSVEAILMHFETMFACEIQLIVQAFHVAVFKRVSNATTK